MKKSIVISFCYEVGTPDEDGFWGFIPGMGDGSCSTQGETLEELATSMQEASSLWIEEDKSNHKFMTLDEIKKSKECNKYETMTISTEYNISSSKTKKINVTMPAETINSIDELVAISTNQISRSGYITQVVNKALASK